MVPPQWPLATYVSRDLSSILGRGRDVITSHGVGTRTGVVKYVQIHLIDQVKHEGGR